WRRSLPSAESSSKTSENSTAPPLALQSCCFARRYGANRDTKTLSGESKYGARSDWRALARQFTFWLSTSSVSPCETSSLVTRSADEDQLPKCLAHTGAIFGRSLRRLVSARSFGRFFSRHSLAIQLLNMTA